MTTTSSPIGSVGRVPNAWLQSSFSGGSGVELEPDFNEFCALLNAHRVEFAIVGAYALAFHGAPRYTGDLDILVRPTGSKDLADVDALRPGGAG